MATQFDSRFNVRSCWNDWSLGNCIFSPELISEALKGADQKTIDNVRGWGLAMQDAGSFLGMIAFTWAASTLGRKTAFSYLFILILEDCGFCIQLLAKTD